MRRPSQPMLGHAASASTSSLSQELRAGSSYAPSVYAQSTLAASTIMPGMSMQPVRNTATVEWQEGHCLQWRPNEDKATCSICDEKSDEGLYRCSGKFQITHSIAPADPTQAAPHMPMPDAPLPSALSVPRLLDPTKCVHPSYDASPVCYTRIAAILCRPPAIARSLACTTSSRWKNS